MEEETEKTAPIRNEKNVKKKGAGTQFILGLVGSPFGLKGFVKVKPFSGETGHFSRLEKVTLRQAGKEETRGIAEIVLQGNEGSSRNQTLLIRFAGVDNPEAAGKLKGAEIIADRVFAAPLNEGEYYVEDLKGLEVINGERETLGHVADVVEGGGGDLVEVELLSGERRFVPFRKEFFASPDAKKGTIELLEPWILDQ